MIKKMYGYKVLSTGRKSARSVAWVIDDAPLYVVHYPTNVRVFPKHGTLLFFFKNIEDAQNFSENGDSVVKCVGYNCRQLKLIAEKTSIINDFWKLKNQKKGVTVLNPNDRYSEKRLKSPPTGTWLAESIMCIE